MSEYISREAAIEAMGSLLRQNFLCVPDSPTQAAATAGYMDGVKDADIRLRSIPAADVVEVRQGWWIAKNADGSWRVDTCSVCNKDTHYVRFAPEYDFCPNCGAKMDLPEPPKEEK